MISVVTCFHNCLSYAPYYLHIYFVLSHHVCLACFVYNGSHLVWFVEVPVTFTVPLKDISTTEGNTVTLECQVNKPGQKVIWYKDGKKLLKPDGEMDADGVTFRLTLKDANPIDAASYTAKCAKAQTSAKVEVKGSLGRESRKSFF